MRAQGRCLGKDAGFRDGYADFSLRTVLGLVLPGRSEWWETPGGWLERPAGERKA